MAYNGSEQHCFEDDDLFPERATETEADWQRLFASATQADSTYIDLDPIFSQSILSTAPTEDAIKHQISSSQSESTFEPSHPPKLKSKSSCLPSHAVNILAQWLEKHSNHPYPTKDEKSSLAEETGLTVAQVSTWFANARRRYKRGSFGNRLSEPEPIRTSLEVPLTSRETWPFMSPLDRWENSPPEIEPAPLEAIINAVARSEHNSLGDKSFVNGEGISALGDDNLSIALSNQTGPVLSSSSNSSVHSYSSSISGASFGCFYLEEPRRRRRRRRRNAIKTTATHKRPFQCTFCTDTFRTKHDWTRHEKTLHLSLESFTCAPFGCVYTSPTDGIDHCVFCDEPTPTESHTEGHRFTSCQLKPSSFRTFYRKDHLIQHLRLLHGVTRAGPVIDTWKSQVDHINSRCGFCGDRFTLWSERNNHIAQHFRDGALMKDWQGCRGLDPVVALAVENAMPPYLIGIESTGMDPFSASWTTDKGGSLSCAAEETSCNLTGGQNPTFFEHLTACLTKYVQQMITAGQIITDEMLQKEARRLVYGDDDPWNQTPADNAQWLRLFKEGVGLEQGSGVQTEPSEGIANWGCNEYNFCLPWSAEPWAPTGSYLGGDPSNLNSTFMAWAWQSPECLAEFRRNMQALSDGQSKDADFGCNLQANHL
ncbi:hypothetical protein AbraIFM66950_005110 [Aspergillus brasiliensis]|nr:hypothetical protein AbraIFM66950_005110 [Aspergillus brasiliensis]